jgi:hypothetical protein
MVSQEPTVGNFFVVAMALIPLLGLGWKRLRA